MTQYDPFTFDTHPPTHRPRLPPLKPPQNDPPLGIH
jgi:hypothetical protein